MNDIQHTLLYLIIPFSAIRITKYDTINMSSIIVLLHDKDNMTRRPEIAAHVYRMGSVTREQQVQQSEKWEEIDHRTLLEWV